MARDNLKNLQITKPGLFSPTITRGIRQGSASEHITYGRTANTLSDSNINSTSSFKFSVDGEGLKSTQQLNVDYSNFANHTFFNSAQVKTNVAFDIIFNGFPFDGTKHELEDFFSGLTGYEKWVYDNLPKNKGYMFFSGSTVGEPNNGTYLTIIDRLGAAFPTISKKTTGKSILSPGDKSMTFEMQLYLPTLPSTRSVVLDKHEEPTSSTKNGFYIGIEESDSLVSGTVSFWLLSGSVYDRIDLPVEKGRFNHLSFVWDRTPGIEKVFAYVNQELITASSQSIEFGYITANSGSMYIGSGSQLTGLFVPEVTLTGAIDELRIWHKTRTVQELKLYAEKNVYSQDGLTAYYRFNEPSGSNSNVVLDYSGNSLHARINAYGLNLDIQNIATASIAGVSPITYEKLADCPILFPAHPDVFSYQTTLLTSASLYDQANPNIITRMVPPHYLAEGSTEEGFETDLGDMAQQIQGGNDPRQFNLGGTQTLLLLLYTWAKFFDELKLYVQTLSTLRSVDYDPEDTVPDQFLLDFARNEGIELPPLFNGSTIEQFLEAENIQSDISTNDLTLQSIRNQIWRRVLINLQDVLRSKGTIHSVKSFIRSVGVDPDNNFRIREYGGPTNRPLTFVREKRSEISTLLNFISGSNPTIISPYLSASRTEPGFPEITGQASDIYLTSGSWTYEGQYKFIPGSHITTSQSLVRFFVDSTGSYGRSTVANLVSVKGGSTTLYVKANPHSASNLLSLHVTGADIFDGQPWYVSFGRFRADQVESHVSASYFLRLAKQEYGEIVKQFVTQSYFDETYPLASAEEIVWSSTSSLSDLTPSNGFAPAIIIGSESLNNSSSNNAYINSSTNNNPTSLVTDFYGKVGHVRFWSKGLTDLEWPEHVKNFRSVGVQDPTTNFNFSLTPTGSWERLRLDISTDQPITKSDGSGEILLTDFTQNMFTFSGSGFDASRQIIDPEKFFFSYISPKFDEAATTEKIRIRGYQNYDDVVNTPWAQVAPAYDIERSEMPTDNTRFTVDFSVVDALNQDIITIFSSLKALDNALGSPELQFSPDYPKLEDMRQIYFNKLTDKMNLRLFFDFFKWFDTNIGTFIAQLLPRKTKFLGTNFVVESHMLERPKVEYQFSDIYLGDNNRHSLKDTILLQLITGEFKKY